MNNPLVTGTLALILACGPALAIEIGPGDFGPGAVMESFEGLPVPESGFAYLPFGYGFPSGVVFAGPDSAGQADETRIGDFLAGDASVPLLWPPPLSSASQVPFGSAFVVSGGDSWDGLMTFTFPPGTFRAGAYISGGNDLVNVWVSDGWDMPVGAGSISTGLGIDNWADNFIGFESATGIHTMWMEGISLTMVAGPRHLLVDGVTFEVPEPATLSLLALGGLAMLRRRRSC